MVCTDCVHPLGLSTMSISLSRAPFCVVCIVCIVMQSKIKRWHTSSTFRPQICQNHSAIFLFVIHPFGKVLILTLSGTLSQTSTLWGISPCYSLKMIKAASLWPDAWAESITIKPTLEHPVLEILIVHSPRMLFVYTGTMSKQTIVWSALAMLKSV